VAYKLRREDAPLYRIESIDGAQAGIFRAGMEPLICQLLDSQAIPYVVSGCRPPALPEPRLASLPPGIPADLELISRLARDDRLLIRVDSTRVEVVRLVAQLARAWPGLRIVVATLRTRDANRHAACLRTLGLHVVSRRGLTGVTDPPPRLAVATYARLDIGAVDLSRVDLVVCADALESLGTVASRVIAEAHRARLVGFLGLHAVVSGPDRDALLERYGPRGLTILRHGSWVRPARVVFEPFGAALPAAKDAPLLKIKREGIWQHRLRNRLLASLAKSLLAAEHASLAARFPRLADMFAGRRPRTVLVLVEVAEHASALSRLLPDWTCLVTSASARHFVHTGGPPAWCIATARAARRLDLAAYDVLVRADGGTGLPPGLSAQSLSVVGEHAALVVVDFGDRHHPELRHHARCRREAYLEAGWPVGESVQGIPELARFLTPRQGEQV
jgi:hypothetical protein